MDRWFCINLFICSSANWKELAEMGWEPGLKSLKLNENKRSWKLTLVADEIMMGRIFEDSFFLCQTLRVELPVRPTIWVTIHLFLVNNRKLLCNSYRRLQNHFCYLHGPKNSHLLVYVSGLTVCLYLCYNLRLALFGVGLAHFLLVVPRICTSKGVWDRPVSIG